MLDNVVLLLQEPQFLCGFIFVVGAVVGSFLNVVIYRLPVMLNREWKQECHAYLQEDYQLPELEKPSQPFNLIVPVSTCPKCQSKIKPWHNLPIAGWLMLKGKCANCKSPISPRYPIIEAITAIMSLFVAARLGFGLELVVMLLLTWGLIALTWIDIDTMLLPDQLTLPLLWLGLLASTAGLTISPTEAIIGAAIGYLSLWSVYWLFKLLTGKEGMGYGDFKLLAVFGAFLGWKYILLIILLSSFVGAIIGSILIYAKHDGESKPFPFGPYIAIAGWIAIFWGEQILTWYMGFFR